MSAFLVAISAAQTAALQRYGVRQIGAVILEPITLVEALDHLQVMPGGWADDWIRAQIPGARESCEVELALMLAPRTLELSTNAFPSGCIELPFGPVESITNVTYTDTDGDPQTMPDTDYELDLFHVPARLSLVYGASWPSARDFRGSVKVLYVAGFSNPAVSPQVHSLPGPIRSAMLFLLAHRFANREAVNVGGAVTEMPMGVMWNLNLYSERMGMA